MHKLLVRKITCLALSAFSIVLTGAAAQPVAQSPQQLFATSTAGSTRTVDHSAWDRLLKRYVRKSAGGLNRVDYAGFKAGGHAALKEYIRSLEHVDPRRLDRSEQFAFLVNLYNAKTIDIVLDHYPVASIKDISLGGGLFSAFTGGPWKAKVITLGGVELSLDDIEHEILRPIFRDPRVHYAVNCASVGCPNLAAEAYTGAKLNAQLDAAARGYVNSRRGIRFTAGGLTVSSIFKWYQQDFGGTEGAVLAHLQTYAAPALAAKLKAAPAIVDYAYDWSLNDLAP